MKFALSTDCTWFEYKLKLYYIQSKQGSWLCNQQIMNQTSNIFEQTVSWVQSKRLFPSIFTKVHQTYDIQTFRIHEYRPEQILKSYKNLQNKYKNTQQLVNDPNNWNQNERKIFLCFIICYAHRLHLESLTLNNQHWENISASFFNKKPEFLHFQYLNILKPKKRVSWNQAEDDLLVQAVRIEKPGKWNDISKCMFYQSNRNIFKSPKHCRERWLNHLDQNKIHGSWTPKEDYIIFKYVQDTGKRWSKIVPLLNETRTEHMIKNRFNTVLSKSRTNPRQTEEDIIRRVLRHAARHIQSQQGQRVQAPQFSNSISRQLEEIQVQQAVEQPPVERVVSSVREQAVQSMREQEQPQNEPVVLSTNMFPPPVPDFGMSMGSFYEYNTMLYMNQFYYQQYAMMPENQQFIMIPDMCGNLPPTADTHGSRPAGFHPYGLQN